MQGQPRHRQVSKPMKISLEAKSFYIFSDQDTDCPFFSKTKNFGRTPYVA